VQLHSLQYSRRLLRLGKLEGLKIGQIWLIDMAYFEAYLAQANDSSDQRFGPKSFFSSEGYIILHTNPKPDHQFVK
jgi:hypothetical protein